MHDAMNHKQRREKILVLRSESPQKPCPLNSDHMIILSLLFWHKGRKTGGAFDPPELATVHMFIQAVHYLIIEDSKDLENTARDSGHWIHAKLPMNMLETRKLTCRRIWVFSYPDNIITMCLGIFES